MKTAVEWLINALNKEMGLISFVPNADEEYKKEIFNIIQQAKEMEREQIVKAWWESPTMGRYCSSEEYYNKTFKQNHQ
jgi:hypothetical protein